MPPKTPTRPTTPLLKGGLSDNVWNHPITQAYARDGSHGWLHAIRERTIEHDQALERALRLNPETRFNDKQIAAIICSSAGRRLADAAEGRTPEAFAEVVHAWLNPLRSDDRRRYGQHLRETANAPASRWDTGA